MKFDRIRVHAFGPLSDLDTGPEPLPDLVVLQAPNEGGKSSFFLALSTLLYGFYPASRDRHPYAPWSGADADIEGRIHRHDGEELDVHRRLLSSPWGRVTRGSEVKDVANRTLACAGHLRRELFDEVFALTLGDLARVDEESWQEIQDRLLGAMGAEDVRSTRSVVQDLESEADSLWRTDRRGKPRARRLRKRLEKLNRQRREAKERDRAAREAARELEQLRERVEETRRERRKVRAVVERARTLAPVRDELRRIEHAEEQAGDPEALEGLPSEPADAVKELEEGVRDRREKLAELNERIERLEERAGALTDGDRALLEHSTRVRELSKMAGEVTSARQRLRTLDEKRASLDRRTREVERNLFSPPWDGVDSGDVGDVPLGELRSRVRRYRKAADEASSLDDRLEALERSAPPDEDPGAPVLGVLLGIGGAMLIAWGLLTGPADAAPGGGVAGGVLLLAGIGSVALLGGLLWTAVRIAEIQLLRKEREAYRREAEGVRERCREARRDVEAERGSVREVLGDLPVSEVLLEDPDPELVHLLEEIHRFLEDRSEIRRERERLSDRIENARTRLAETADAVGMPRPAEFLAGVVALEERLEEAATRQAEARAAEESLTEARDTLDRLREEKERKACRLERLRTRLVDLGDGSLERGVERAEKRMRARDRARTFREELERKHPDLDDLRRRIREAEEEGEEWTVDEESLIRSEDRAEELHEEEKELIERIADREAELRELEGQTTLDRVEGEILQVRERLERIRRRRDRLVLLSGIVRAADRRFRDRNQPDLLRSAGRYLEVITAGRYRRLLMPESDLDGTLYLEGPGYPHPVEVASPVSTGTREQVYLALRLAIVEHLDAGSERLPLFLDEAFVNWDAERRERGFSVLADLAEERQVFVFTCHEPMARGLEERGARLIRLDGPG